MPTAGILRALGMKIAILAGDGIVACRSTTMGTHQGPLNIGPMAALPISGARIEVPHMHFFRYRDGRLADLWHVWDTGNLLRQLGVGAPPVEVGPGVAQAAGAA